MNDDDFKRRLAELEEDRVHGASELARRCLRIAAASAFNAPAGDTGSLRRLLDGRAAAMAGARPSMAALGNLMARWRAALGKLPEDDLEAARRKAAEAALALVEESRRAVQEIAARTRELVGRDRTIITHSLSSTMLEVFHQLADRGVRAIITESRPLYEGRRLAARLSEWSVPTTFITDAQLGHFMQQADFAIVGADSMLPDGSVVNKAGTYLLALAANDQGVPFYVCCESFKRGTAEPKLEEMDAAELGAPGWPHVTVANLYFDVTPARLVSGWISEEGGPDPVFPPPDG